MVMIAHLPRPHVNLHMETESRKRRPLVLAVNLASPLTPISYGDDAASAGSEPAKAPARAHVRSDRKSS
jgi:hypothetical protein